MRVQHDPATAADCHGCGTDLHGEHTFLHSSRRDLAAGCCWSVRRVTGCLVWALAVVVPATRRGTGLSFVKPVVARRVGGSGDLPVESLFPKGGGCIELFSASCWLRVLGREAVCGPPHCDLADEGGA
jgi:hypothetical protein